MIGASNLSFMHAECVADIVGDENDKAVGKTDVGAIPCPKEEQDRHSVSPSVNGPLPQTSSPTKLLEDKNDRPLSRTRSEPQIERALPVRKASLPLLGLDTIESMADLPPVRRTSGRTGSYDDGQTASETLTTDDEDEVEIIVDSSMRQDGDKSSKFSSERKGSTTIGDSQSRVPRSLDGGVVGFGMGTPSTPPSEHQGNGVACRFYNRERCIKGSACPWSHAPDTYSLRSRPDGKNVCMYFIHNNKCRFDAKGCNYSHRLADLAPWDNAEIARQLQLKLDERKAGLKHKKEKKEKVKEASDGSIIPTPLDSVLSGPELLSVLSNGTAVAPSATSNPMHASPKSFTASSISISTPTIGSVRDSQILQENASTRKKKSKRPPMHAMNPASPLSMPPRQQQYSTYPYSLPLPSMQTQPYLYPYPVTSWGVPQVHQLHLLHLASLPWVNTNTQTFAVPNSNPPQSMASAYNGEPLLPLSGLSIPEQHRP